MELTPKAGPTGLGVQNAALAAANAASAQTLSGGSRSLACLGGPGDGDAGAGPPGGIGGIGGPGAGDAGGPGPGDDTGIGAGAASVGPGDAGAAGLAGAAVGPGPGSVQAGSVPISATENAGTLAAASPPATASTGPTLGGTIVGVLGDVAQAVLGPFGAAVNTGINAAQGDITGTMNSALGIGNIGIPGGIVGMGQAVSSALDNAAATVAGALGVPSSPGAPTVGSPTGPPDSVPGIMETKRGRSLLDLTSPLPAQPQAPQRPVSAAAAEVGRPGPQGRTLSELIILPNAQQDALQGRW